ncbi:MAG: 3'(2'),5'-bisphosphate nucleotidase CysQ [Chloracidobacterium sp.]|nr:3'(2'),5'-bisphosphate nucleotidase CysQ [Chloracidobacterium sp.]
MYEFEMQAAVDLARKAGEAILRHYSAPKIVAENKIGIDERDEPVTAADIEASRIIVDGLNATFPDDAILSEEETDETDGRMASDRVWIVDPIDGTAGFIKKDDDFAVQIGLAEAGKPVVGVVFVPARNTLYFASGGHGAFIEEGRRSPERLSVSDKTDLSEMDIAVSRDHRSPKMTRIIGTLGLRSEIGRGSVGIKIGMIAEQVCDLYIHISHRTKFWDTCAPQIILEEAGGKITDLFGTPFRYDRSHVMNLNGIVASNRVAHDATIEKLIPILNELGRARLTRAA